MVEFFPLGKKECKLNTCTSIAVWGYECCQQVGNDCCGYVSVSS
ncbi:hypothetical protein GCK32_006152, partial [Trichostrongylus colubriformis]